MTHEHQPKDQLRIGDEPVETNSGQDETSVAHGKGSESPRPNAQSPQPYTVREDQDRADWDRMSGANYPMTGQQIRDEVGSTLLTGEDIERHEVDTVRRRLAQRPPKQRTRRPFRGRGSDNVTDLSIRAVKSATDEPTLGLSPDADIDEIFGAEQARKIL